MRKLSFVKATLGICVGVVANGYSLTHDIMKLSLEWSAERVV
jgi:hypothetical protein